MNCKNCGAPLEFLQTKCSYCGGQNPIVLNHKTPVDIIELWANDELMAITITPSQRAFLEAKCNGVIKNEKHFKN